MYQTFSASIDQGRLHDLLYSGVIARFNNLEAMNHILAHARQFVCDQLAPWNPVEIHRHHSSATLAQILSRTQKRYNRSNEANRLWVALFEEVGFDPRCVARDRLIIRFQPPTQPESVERWNRSTATAHFHRDSWGTNLYSQINWWTPLYHLAADRTLGFFPSLWDVPLSNSSAAFDIRDVLHKAYYAPERLTADDISPRLLQPIQWEKCVPVLIDPGQIIAFSCQHAHSGIGNHTRETRISLETRTLLIDDQRASRGAPNIDGRAQWMTPGMFRRVSDGADLAGILNCPSVTDFTGPWPVADSTS